MYGRCSAAKAASSVMPSPLSIANCDCDGSYFVQPGTTELRGIFPLLTKPPTFPIRAGWIELVLRGRYQVLQPATVWLSRHDALPRENT